MSDKDHLLSEVLQAAKKLRDTVEGQAAESDEDGFHLAAKIERKLVEDFDLALSSLLEQQQQMQGVGAPASPSVPSAVAVAPSAEAADQGLRAPSALTHRPLKFRAWVPAHGGGHCMDYDVYIGSDGTPFDLATEEYGGPNIEIQAHPEYAIMQFTGLRDVEGREIYEGDVLKPRRYLNTAEPLLQCEVYFDAGAFRVRGKPLAVCMADAKRAGNEYVVIGNIYEHPHLLRVSAGSGGRQAGPEGTERSEPSDHSDGEAGTPK